MSPTQKRAPPAPLPGRLDHLGYGLGGGLCGGSVVGAAEGLYVLASTRPAEYQAFAYGAVLYGSAGLCIGLLLGVCLALFGRAAGFGGARAWSASFGAAVAALATAVGEARLVAPLGAFVGNPKLVVVTGAAVLGLSIAWLFGHLLAKTPLRVLVSFRGTVAAWLLGIGVAVLLSVSPAPGAALTLAPGRAPPDGGQPDVLLVVVGGLRADAIGAGTPALAALAADAVVFEETVATSGATAPAFASLFTSVPPSLHGVDADGSVLADAPPTLAEVLRDAGYATGGLPNAASVTGTRGFDRGFDWYPYTWRDPLRASESAAGLVLYARLRALWEARVADPPVDAWHTPAARQLETARTFLDANADARSFLFVHLAEPNLPWFTAVGQRVKPTTRLSAPEAHALYAAEVRRVDTALGSFLDGLRAAGRYDDALIVVTGGCGEELLEHGRVGHGATLRETVLRVPLVVKLPGNARAGTRIPWQVRAVDVAPTIVEAAGLLPPPAWRGATVFDDWFEDDLARLVPADAEAPFTPPTWIDHPGSRPALAELYTGSGRMIAIRDGGLKLVRTRGGVLPSAACYDLVVDPDERLPLPTDDLPCRRADIADAMLGGWTGVRPPPTPVEDPEELGVVEADARAP